jgi:hypothetical protein
LAEHISAALDSILTLETNTVTLDLTANHPPSVLDHASRRPCPPWSQLCSECVRGIPCRFGSSLPKKEGVTLLLAYAALLLLRVIVLLNMPYSATSQRYSATRSALLCYRQLLLCYFWPLLCYFWPLLCYQTTVTLLLCYWFARGKAGLQFLVYARRGRIAREV